MKELCKIAIYKCEAGCVLVRWIQRLQHWNRKLGKDISIKHTEDDQGMGSSWHQKKIKKTEPIHKIWNKFQSVLKFRKNCYNGIAPNIGSQLLARLDIVSSQKFDSHMKT